jgi:hypothetical protein
MGFQLVFTKIISDPVNRQVKWTYIEQRHGIVQLHIELPDGICITRVSPHLANIFPLLLQKNEYFDGFKSPAGIGSKRVTQNSKATYSASLLRE